MDKDLREDMEMVARFALFMLGALVSLWLAR